MSYDLTLHSPSSRACSKTGLADALRDRGWYAVFPGDGDTVATGTLYGTRDRRHAEAVAAALAAEDAATLQPLIESEAVGLCELIVHVPFDFRAELEPDELEELVEEGPSRVIENMLAARSHYLLTTSLGRSDASLNLQTAVWEALGDLVLGLLEDPQEGRSILVTPEEREELAAG